jgi:hypothetical protein
MGTNKPGGHTSSQFPLPLLSPSNSIGRQGLDAVKSGKDGNRGDIFDISGRKQRTPAAAESRKCRRADI